MRSDSIFMRVYFHPEENNFLIKFFEYLAGIDNNHHKKVFHFQLLRGLNTLHLAKNNERIQFLLLFIIP